MGIILQEDTRQKVSKHKTKHDSFDAAGDTVIRSKLLFGDYALPPAVAVDTKENVLEIAYNMCGCVSEKKRFAAECYTARLCNSKLVYLIEDSRYKEPSDLIGEHFELHNGVTIPGTQLYNAMVVTSGKYGVEFRFCKPEESAEVIKEILLNG